MKTETCSRVPEIGRRCDTVKSLGLYISIYLYTYLYYSIFYFHKAIMFIIASPSTSHFSAYFPSKFKIARVDIKHNMQNAKVHENSERAAKYGHFELIRILSYGKINFQGWFRLLSCDVYLFSPYNTRINATYF